MKLWILPLKEHNMEFTIMCTGIFLLLINFNVYFSNLAYRLSSPEQLS